MSAIGVFNAGSSSIKCALFATSAGEPTLLARAQIERLDGEARFVTRQGGARKEAPFSGGADPHAAAAQALLGWMRDIAPAGVAAVGHRVVHGGARFVAATRIDAEVIAAIDALTPLAPLHQPHNLAIIRALEAHDPTLLQVACFDTAFHATMSPIERAFALDQALETAGVRRYGFHGLSYELIAHRLRERDPAIGKGKVVVAHLGNGASMCAMLDGRSVATTMGFTALEGLVMGTRPGDLDPGVLLYLMQARGMDAAAIEDLLYHRSGLLGVSGETGDMEKLLASKSPRAAFAVELFCHRAVRTIGSLTAALGGLDALVFTGGIGEHAVPVRARIVQGSAWLGLSLDPAANEANRERIDGGGKPVYVLPTDEEWVIARQTAQRLSA